MDEADDMIAQFRANYPWYCKQVAYLSGPISKYGFHSAMRHWHEASVIEGRLVGEGWEVHNPGSSVHARDNFNDEYVTKDEWMNHAKSKLLEMAVMMQLELRDVAVIIMLDGWEESDGAWEEYTFAASIGIPAYKFMWVDQDDNHWKLVAIDGGTV
jgi:hypothetical protein